ncbi:MAG: rane protein [Pseudonocardiales bacterium]|nr:rane protein [Pseudonocardiales bacterium]
MTRPSAPERQRSTSEDRRKHLELQRARLEQRHARISADVRPPTPKGWWRRFVAQFGWRAYALPLLVIITVLALFTTNTGSVRTKITGATPAAPGSTASTPPTAAADGQLKSDVPGAHANNEVLASDALPSGKPYTTQGAGTFQTIPGTSGVLGTGRLFKFSVEVETGVSGIDLNAFAQTVMQTLGDPKSWIGGKNVSLQRVDAGPVDFHIALTSSLTVRKLCGYDIQIETSCFAPGDQNRVVLNDARWVRGDAAYIGDPASYRQYMINHETGHALGHAHAHQCLANGLAPVMMQQTIGLKTASGQRCAANQWPYPTGAADAPGAEQPTTAADQAFVNQNS